MGPWVICSTSTLNGTFSIAQLCRANTIKLSNIEIKRIGKPSFDGKVIQGQA
jgi:hypothetical protein